MSGDYCTCTRRGLALLGRRQRTEQVPERPSRYPHQLAIRRRTTLPAPPRRSERPLLRRPAMVVEREGLRPQLVARMNQKLGEHPYAVAGQLAVGLRMCVSVTMLSMRTVRSFSTLPPRAACSADFFVPGAV